MPVKSLNVKGYVGNAVQNQLAAQSLDISEIIKANQSSAKDISNSFKAASKYLSSLMSRDEDTIKRISKVAEQIQTSLNQLGVVKSIFNPSQRAMRKALQDSLGSERFLANAYKRHLSAVNRAMNGLMTVEKLVSSANKDRSISSGQALKSVQNIHNDLHD